MKHGDFPSFFVCLPEGRNMFFTTYSWFTPWMRTRELFSMVLPGVSQWPNCVAKWCKNGCKMTGWWFGTWLDYEIPYIGNHHPNWLIFFRGVGIPPTSHSLPHVFRPKNSKNMGYDSIWLECIDSKANSWISCSNELVLWQLNDAVLKPAVRCHCHGTGVWGTMGNLTGRRRRSLKSLSRPVNLTFVFEEDVPEIPKMKMMKTELRLLQLRLGMSW